MLNPHLSDSQINQMFFIDDNGFIRRKKITGYIQLSNVIKLLWNRKANQIITAPSIKITGYKREKTEYIKDVLLFGREVADKKADAAKIARYKDKKASLVSVEKYILFSPKSKIYIVSVGSRDKAKFKNLDDARNHVNRELKKLEKTKDAVLKRRKEIASSYWIDNSDLFTSDFVDYSANNQIGYLSVYG